MKSILEEAFHAARLLTSGMTQQEARFTWLIPGFTFNNKTNKNKIMCNLQQSCQEARRQEGSKSWNLVSKK